MINFKNKNILITGASGGIGNELVKKFISLEGNVLATGTNAEKLDKLKKKRPETDQVFVFGLPYIDNFLKSLKATGIQAPDSSSITWEMIYLPSIKLFHEKCFKTIMIPNENDVLNFIINQVCEGDMSVEHIDSKNIMSEVIKTGLRTILSRSEQDKISFTKLLIDTINNQYFSKLEPFKERIIKDESINIGGLLIKGSS